MRILKQSEEVKNTTKKSKSLLYVMIVSFLLLLFRLFYLQVVKGDEYFLKSRDNFILQEKIFPARGDILTSDGKVLASTDASFKISIIPVFFSTMDQIEEQIDRISTVLDIGHDERNILLSKVKDCVGRCRYLPFLIKDEIPRKKFFKFSSYLTNFPGIIISSSYKRVYPYGENSAHITGYVSKINQNELATLGNYDPEDFTGKTGLEKSYEQILHGTYGEAFHIIDHMGRKIEVPENIDETVPKSKPAQKGDSLRTTILSYLQETASSAFGETSGAAVVMEINTGSILAMHSSPSFNSNLLSRKRIPDKIWREYSQSVLRPLVNKVTMQTYYPGSTFKVVSALAGLHYHEITPMSTFLCQGCLWFGSDTKCCWNKWGHGYVNLKRSLKESCDIYYYDLSEKLGLEKITHMASLFGVGSKTGIDFPGEEAGILPDREWFNMNYPGMKVHKGLLMNLAIGQGDVRMTPLQLAVLYGAFANHGVIVKPKLGEEVISQDGTITKIPDEIVRVLDINDKHFENINKALWSVTNELGGTAFFHADHTIPDAAGKTGTSQVISNSEKKMIDDSEDEKRLMTEDDALFVAFFPFKNPQIVAVAVVENGGHGGSVAAPIVYKLLKSYYYKRSFKE
ncbi:MAG TPA: penicillin-binding protein 2 [bacterium]|nr:penicillin-binding protein 2 [bacterium]HPS29254.1 penicillin-binding protein 2 [bacterium]